MLMNTHLFTLAVMLVVVGGFGVAVLDCDADTAVGVAGTFDCAAVTGGSSAISLIGVPVTLNPVTATDPASGLIIDYALGGAFYESYAFLGQDATIIAPQLASVIDRAIDGLSVTFTLRDGLMFSDGSPVTGEDLLYWYNDVIFNPNLPNSLSTAFSCLDGSPFDISISGSDVTVSCPEAFRTFVDNAADIPVYSRQMALDFINAQAIPTEEGINGPRALQEFMGLGIDISLMRSLSPFTMSEFVSDLVAVFERNPNSYMVDSNGTQLPYLNVLIININPSNGQNLSLSAFLNGQTDFIVPRAVGIAPILAQAASGGFVINSDIDNGIPAIGTQWVTLNFDDENPNIAAVSRNATVRRALSLTTDRIAMVENVLLGLGTPTYVNADIVGPFAIGRNNTCADFISAGLVTAGTCAGGVWRTGEDLSVQVAFLPPPDADFIDHLSCLNNYAACVRDANDLLDGLGLTDSDGNGIRNIPPKFDGADNPGDDWRIQVTTNVGNTDRESFIQIICDSWAHLSIQCTTNPVPFSTLVTQLLGIEGATWTGAIMLGLTGGDPAGGFNVYQCGTALYFWHLSCDPSAVDGPTVQLRDGGGTVEDGFDAGFAAISDTEAESGFDAMQRAWIQTEPFIQLAVGNAFFAARIDRTCNDGRAVVANFEVKYRTDVAGNEGTCSSNVGR